MQRFKQLTLNGSTSAMALLAALVGAPAMAGAPLPVGGTVVVGNAQIGAPAGNSVSINQSSANAIINWQSFDVGAGKTVIFNQPGTNSATLNRVTGNTTSTIAGQITANGSVYLINPNGIQITRSGVVNVGRGFVASTLDIADQDFLAGKGAFTGAGGAVRNAGTITTQTGGYVGLLGGAVSNTGLIIAPAGRVVIGAGTTATLDLNGDGFLQVALPVDAALSSTGNAAALTGAQARQAVRNIVNLPGSINARSVAGRDGDVVLSGTINVDSASGNAGTIKVLGNNVTASGTLTARALGANGKGGSVETSGNNVDFTGIHVDTTAAHGLAGTWLVDPTDLTVDASAASTISGNLATTNVSLQTTSTTASGTGNTSAGLGDITVNSAINWSSATSLTLSAYQSIIFNAAVTATGNGTLNLTTNNNIGATSSGGALTFNSAGNVQLQCSSAALNINNTSYTLIHTVSDLLAINNNPSGNYALAQPLDMGGTTYTQSPIAQGITGNDFFFGVFNGLNNTISNLTINVTNSSENVIGLFGLVGTQYYNSVGTVSNLGLIGGSVVNNTVAYADVGGLVGENTGTLTNVWSSASVSSNQFSSEMGGLVGYNWGTISGAHASGSVTTTASLSYAGGLVGYNDGYSAAANNAPSNQPGIITNSYATGAVHGGSGTGGAGNGGGSGSDTGGLVGANLGTVTNVYSTGAVTGTAGTYIGGLIGQNDTADNGGIAAVNNGYWDATTSGIASVAQGAGTPLTTAQLQNGTLPSGFSATIWTASSGAYPALFQSPPATTPLTYSVSNASGTYGTQATPGLVTLSGSPANVSGTVSLYTTYSGGALSGLVTLSATLGAGTYYEGVSALTGSAAANYTIASSGNTVGTLIIHPLAVTISGSQIYNGSRTINGTSLGVTNAVSGDTVTIGGSIANGVASPNAGSTAQNLSSLTGLTLSNANYTLTGGSGTVTIAPAALIVTGSKTYDGTSSFATGQLSVSNGVSGETIVLTSGTGTAGSQNFGATSGSLSGLGISVTGGQGLASNYSLPSTGTLTINKASLTITPLAQSATYGTAYTLQNGLGVGYSQSGLVSGETISGVTLTASGTGSASGTTATTAAGGNYTIAASGATGSTLANYTIAYGAPATLTVNPATISVTYAVGNAQSVFGTLATLGSVTLTGVTPTDSANVNAALGIFNGSTQVALSNITPVGSYSEQVTGLTGSAASNYTVAFTGNAPGTLTIAKRALTGTVAAGSSIYGATLAPGGVTFTNLVPGAGNVTGTVTVATAGNTSSSGNLRAGSYSGIESVTAIGGTDAGNYSFAGLTGDYTVGQLALVGTLQAGSSTYGSALAPGVASFTNVVTGDVITPGAVSINTAGNTSGSGNLKAGSYTGIESVSTIGGADAGNYSFAGLNGNYNVGQLALTGMLQAGSSTYGSALAPGAASFTNLVAGDVVTPGAVSVATSGNTSTSGNLKAGSYTCIESVSTIGGADAGNYSIAGLTGNYNVGQLALTGTLLTGSSTYGSALAPGAASLTNAVAGDVVTPGAVSVATAGNTSTSGNLRAGSYTGIESVASISGADAGNYSFAGLTGAYTVGQLALTGTLGAGSSTYGSTLTPGAVSITNVVVGDVVTSGAVSINTAGNTSSSGNLKAGIYAGIESVSTISGADAGNYSFAGLTGNYAVGQLALMGTLQAGSSTYGSALAPGTASFTNVVTGDVVTPGAISVTTSGNTSTSGNLKAGSYTGIESVSAIGGADAGNYSFAGLTGAYTVGQLALTGTLGAGSSTYGSTLTPGAVSITNVVVGDVVTPGVVSVATVGNTSTSGNLRAGSYTGIESVTAIGGTDAGNYSFAGLTGDYTVGQLALMGTLQAGSSTYGSALAPGVASFTNVVTGDVVTPGTVSINTAGNISGSGNLKAGSYTGIESVSTIGGADAGNYSFAGLTGAYTVGQLALAGALASGSSIYGSALTPGAVSFTNVVAGDVVTPGAVGVATAGNTSSSGYLNAGNYTGAERIATVGGTDAGNYSFAGLTGDYTVGRAALTVSANAGQSSVYGAAIPTLLYTQGGLVSGDSLSGALAAAAGQGSSVGNYAITQETLSAGSNYVVTYHGATFAITPAVLKYVADPATRFANAANQAFSGRVIGFVLNDTLANATTGTAQFTSSATASSAPGLYPILGSGLTANNGNYLFAQAPGNTIALTINPFVTQDPSQTINQNIQANNAQNSVIDLQAATLNNDVNPVLIIDKTGPATAGAADGAGSAASGQGLCVSYGPGRPKVCLSH